MARAPRSRRPVLLLLAATLVTSAAACSSSPQGGRDAAPATTVTTAPSTTTSTTVASPPLPDDGRPPFDRVNPMSGFVAFGDFGGGAAQGAVAAGMERWVGDGHRVDALVTTGDNVYDFGEPHLFEAYLEAPYRNLLAGGRPMWAALGNHDVMRGHGPAQLEFLGLPPMPYAKRLPGVRLLFLDGNRPNAAQAKWLADQLDDPDPPPFTVAVFHQPVFSCGLHGRTATVIEAWYPLLNSGRVSLVLNGHDHHYERFLTAEGTTFIVTGGGGRNLYPRIPGCHPPELRAGAVKHHFVGVEVYSDRMALTAVGVDGSVIDQVEIPAPLPPP